jgi:hypothetical protein
MQKIQLSIPEPCHQNWHKMNPTEQGRFCNACAKQVVDFSNMSDTQVLQYFSTVKNEKICGRAYPDQLERAITVPAAPKKKLFWYWNYITMLFLFFSKLNSVKAQGMIAYTKELKVNNLGPGGLKNTLAGKLKIKDNAVIKGKITDKAGEPVSFATVRIKGANNGINADENGFYTIKVNTKTDMLEINAVGFTKKEIKLVSSNTFDIILFKMERLLMGDTVVTAIDMDGNGFSAVAPKHIAVFEVKDNATLQPVSKASVIIKRVGNNVIDTVATDANGIYKIKKIKEDEIFSVKVIAEGFREEEIIVKGSDLAERKELKQIFLEKKPGLSDYKRMDSVVVSSGFTMGKLSCRTGSISVINFENRNIFTDSLKSMVSKINGTIKISPNPIQKGNPFMLTLKLKQEGTYNIQIANAAGQIVLQRQIYATAKGFTQQIPTGSRWASGIYYVRISDEKNSFINTSSFSLQ